MSREYPSQRLLNQLTTEMIAWLDEPDTRQIAATVRDWDEETRRAAELVTQMQGIGPYLYHSLASTPGAGALPAPFRQFLSREYESNQARVQRLCDELAAILGEANRTGLTVLVLKGLYVASCYYDSPFLRPMADIDLLVQPRALPALRAILLKMGYQPSTPRGRHTTTYNFVRPDELGDGTGYPRPVEVHTHLRRHLWVEHGGYDLTEYVWADSRATELVGEQARAPTPPRLLTYLALHATYDLVRKMGRFLHLLDLAHVLPTVEQIDASQADWVYPALRLAGRALPVRLAGTDLSPLADETHPRLRRWADTVPLDGRSGLNVDPTPPNQRSRWRLRWMRWHPTPERLALAYGHLPLGLAYARHALTLLQQLGPGLRQRP